jgi:uncharacterized Tic20 family protein
MAEEDQVTNVPTADGSGGEPTDAARVLDPAPGAPEVPEAVIDPVIDAPAAAASSLDLDDDPTTQPEAPDLGAVEPIAFSEPIVGPPGLDLSNPDRVAQVTYGQTQQAYTQPHFSAAPPADQPGYTQPSEPPPPYQQAPTSYPPGTYLPTPVAATPMTWEEENMWASAAHWSALVASVVGLGFAGPLIVYLAKSQTSARVRAEAAESLNFEITYILALIVSFLAMFVFIGFITTPFLLVAWLVLRILAAVAASRGENYRYPLAIRLVR